MGKQKTYVVLLLCFFLLSGTAVSAASRTEDTTQEDFLEMKDFKLNEVEQSLEDLSDERGFHFTDALRSLLKGEMPVSADTDESIFRHEPDDRTHTWKCGRIYESTDPIVFCSGCICRKQRRGTGILRICTSFDCTGTVGAEKCTSAGGAALCLISAAQSSFTG